MTASGRPRKRQRTALRDDDEVGARTKAWSLALSSLIERLNAVNADALALKNEQNSHAAEIEETLATTEAAAKAVAKVIPPPPSEDVDIFSRGVRADSEHCELDALKPPPLPAVKLLTEQDPPEKIIHEQSIVVRAQAINRKNAELARERLPKQPEAQRNKTHHDYFLDEAMWMATDFRQERKWKIQTARKVSKMVQQYHAQRAQREARAKIEAQNKLIRLANGIARDVRKFWGQIREIADYRSSLAEEAKVVKERMSQLNQLLERTAAYSNGMAVSLRSHMGDAKEGAVQNAKTERVKSDKELKGSGEDKEAEVQPEANANDAKVADDQSQTEQEIQGIADEYVPEEAKDALSTAHEELDDESTLIAAEAEEEKDAGEVQRLQGEASLSIAELLRSQGIDPAAYTADQNKYLNSDDEDSDEEDSNEEEDDSAMSLEVPSVAAEGTEEEIQGSKKQGPRAELDPTEKEDVLEGERLKSGAKLEFMEALQSQGVAPKCDAELNKQQKDKFGYESRPENGAVSSLTRNGDLEVHRVESHRLSRKDLPQVAPGTSVSAPTDPNQMKPVPPPDASNQPSAVADGKIVSAAVNAVKENANTADLVPGGKVLHEHAGSQKPQQVKDITPRNRTTLSEPSTLLRGSLRDYQREGMTWLTSLYTQKLNGILADEMGLGKTIQTISLLAWLAIEKGVWGPHLVVVPTSVLVNWEMEFKKWLPAFKVLTYFGSLKERKVKRQGWTKAHTFHVCITSYNLAVQDAIPLRRKRWVYLILDEAHNIKNFESQRWQTLLSFPSQRRLLLTGTPLQNSVMELWSLMHFLMPDLFPSQNEFHHWFSRPLAEAEKAESEREGGKGEIVTRLHEVLRPFILRRLKVDVERGLPPKYEHVVKCPLSKRQRQLYEDFMARSDIKETLQTGDFFSVMNVLMQLRKVCNHPDLFEGRPIVSPFSMQPIFYPVPKDVTTILNTLPEKEICLDLLGLNLSSLELQWAGRWHTSEVQRISAEEPIKRQLQGLRNSTLHSKSVSGKPRSSHDRLAADRVICFRRSQLRYHAQRTAMRLRQEALLGEDLRTACSITPRSLCETIRCSASVDNFLPSSTPALIRSLNNVAHRAREVCERFVCCITKASSSAVEFRFPGDDGMYANQSGMFSAFNRFTTSFQLMFRPFEVRSRVTIPDKRLVQWDCGKLQILDKLLRGLKASDSRVLIFTQMTKVLDILESFLNLHSWRYLRLDGTTKTDDRQRIVERFNQDKRVFCMILTTRAGGIGLNLTGADSVVFYDTDYNPAIDNQAQDRAHRIGQTKPVHIYRLVSEQTVEENILRRANEKRNLESLIISEAGFTTDAIAERSRTVSSPPDPKRSPQVAGIAPAENSNGGLTDTPIPGPGNVRDIAKSLPPSVETANGYINRYVAEQSQETKRSRAENVTDGLLNYQDVTNRLLAEEDDRERIAVFTAAKEQEELRAEFEDDHGASGNAVAEAEKTRSKDESALRSEELVSSLTPVQRYALRLIEESTADADSDPDEAESVGFGSRSGLNESESNQPNTSNSRSAEASEEEVISPQPLSQEEEEEPLFYEIDVTENGAQNYLKALTDADADIKVYLPLRDGGPEELKVSSVVSGTAAAGLECAEDAAFYPHAYNRMSRTVYSTYRQRERARANLRKRKAEREARRRRELELAAAAEKEKESAAAALVQATKQSLPPERQRPGKTKADFSRSTFGPPAKKLRADSSVKSKATGTNSATSADGALMSSSGLFRRSSKKASKKLQLPSRSSVTGSANAMPGDDIGENDGWTKNEDQKVITAASEFSNNMKLVADSLTLDASVAAGIRRKRGYKHCLGRLANSLQKDVKSGPPVPRATVSDADIFRKHVSALVVASNALEQKPPAWMTLPAIPTPWHASQTKVTREASANAPKRFSSGRPPTLSSVSPLIVVPPHFRIGLKPTESTPQALNRRRFPFLRPPRDDQRLNAQRPGAPSQRSGMPSQRPGQAVPRGNTGTQRARPAGARTNSQSQRSNMNRQNSQRAGNTSSQVTANTVARTISKQSKGSSAGGTPRSSGTTARGVSGGRSVQNRVTGDGKGLNTSQAAVIPKFGSTSTVRKGVFVAGTSARMNIGQVGGAISNVGTQKQRSTSPVTAGEGKPDVSHKGMIPKQGLSAVNLKGSKILSGNTRIPAFVGQGSNGANGVVRAAPPAPLRNGMGSSSVAPVYSGESGAARAKSGTDPAANVQSSLHVTAAASVPTRTEEASRQGAAQPRPTEDKKETARKDGETG